MQSGRATQLAREFLDRRFARNLDGYYEPHQPIHGMGKGGETGQMIRLARTYRLIRWITGLKPASLLDLGAAEGYIANLVRLRTGCSTMCVDLSAEACHRAWEIYGQPAIASSLHTLPLRDKSVDVVLLSEVFEHLENPLEALNEAVRVCRKYLVFTTQEICQSSLEQWMRLKVRDLDEPHGELNWLHVGDLRRLFSCPTRDIPQYRRTRIRLAADLPRHKWLDHLKWMTNPRRLTSEGVIFIAALDGSPVPSFPGGEDEQLWQMLIDGPPIAEPQVPPWHWLCDTPAPPAAGPQVVVNRFDPVNPLELNPVFNRSAARRLAHKLSFDRITGSIPVRKRLGQLLWVMERFGFATCDDPWPVKWRWIREGLRTFNRPASHRIAID